MSDNSIRPAYPEWSWYDARLRQAVAGLTEGQLAVSPSPERWPLWATIGHLACQRVSWLCGFAGESGAEATPFPDALYRCPGDEYLEPVMTSADLVMALESTFAIIEGCLDRWTTGTLDEEIRRTLGGEEWVHSRGWTISRVFAHDVAHIAEINEALSIAGLPLVDLWR